MTHIQRKEKQTEYSRTQQLKGGLQLFELKQMADMEADYQKECAKAIKAYKAWRCAHEEETDMIELLYGNLEGIVLRRHAEAAVQSYWVIRQDFRHLFKEYLAKSCCYTPSFSKSKAA